MDKERETELTTAMRSLERRVPAHELVAALFDAADSDGSGFMEETEGKRFLATAGCAAAELDYYWQDLVRTADVNKDGKISKDEFLTYILGDEELD